MAIADLVAPLPPALLALLDADIAPIVTTIVSQILPRVAAILPEVAGTAFGFGPGALGLGPRPLGIGPGPVVLAVLTRIPALIASPALGVCAGTLCIGLGPLGVLQLALRLARLLLRFGLRAIFDTTVALLVAAVVPGIPLLVSALLSSPALGVRAGTLCIGLGPLGVLQLALRLARLLLGLRLGLILDAPVALLVAAVVPGIPLLVAALVPSPALSFGTCALGIGLGPLGILLLALRLAGLLLRFGLGPILDAPVALLVAAVVPGIPLLVSALLSSPPLGVRAGTLGIGLGPLGVLQLALRLAGLLLRFGLRAIFDTTVPALVLTLVAGPLLLLLALLLFCASAFLLLTLLVFGAGAFLLLTLLLLGAGTFLLLLTFLLLALLVFSAGTLLLLLTLLLLTLLLLRAGTFLLLLLGAGAFLLLLTFLLLSLLLLGAGAFLLLLTFLLLSLLLLGASAFLLLLALLLLTLLLGGPRLLLLGALFGFRLRAGLVLAGRPALRRPALRDDDRPRHRFGGQNRSGSEQRNERDGQ